MVQVAGESVTEKVCRVDDVPGVISYVYDAANELGETGEIVKTALKHGKLVTVTAMF